MSRRLFLYLHGHGSSPAEVDGVIGAIDPERGYIAVTPEGPLAVSAAGRAWFEGDSRGTDPASLERAVEWVSNVLVGCTTDLGIDMEDVVLGGFSQGAATALAVAAFYDIELGGLLLQAPFVPDGADLDVDLASIRARDVLIQHGSLDDVVPPFFVEHVAASLTATRGDVQRQTFEAGHERTVEMLDAACAWMRGRIS